MGSFRDLGRRSDLTEADKASLVVSMRFLDAAEMDAEELAKARYFLGRYGPR